MIVIAWDDRKVRGGEGTTMVEVYEQDNVGRVKFMGVEFN